VSVYLGKRVALAALPLGWALLLGVAGVLRLLLARRRMALVLLVAQLAVLWTFSMPWMAERLSTWIESAPTRRLRTRG
jgi:hypothetical protein